MLLLIFFHVSNAMQFSKQIFFEKSTFIPLDEIEILSYFHPANLVAFSPVTQCQFLDCKLLCDFQPGCSSFTFSNNICTLGNVELGGGQDDVMAWTKMEHIDAETTEITASTIDALQTASTTTPAIHISTSSTTKDQRTFTAIPCEY